MGSRAGPTGGQQELGSLIARLPEVPQAIRDGYLTRLIDADSLTELPQAVYLLHCKAVCIPYIEVLPHSDRTGLHFHGGQHMPRFTLHRAKFLALAARYGLHGFATESCAFVSFASTDTKNVARDLRRCLSEGTAEEEWQWDA